VRYLLGSGPKPPTIVGGTRADWERWRLEFGSALRRRLGPYPGKGDLRLEMGPPEKVEGCLRRHVLFDPDPFSTVAAWLLDPADLSAGGGRRPGILFAHGHGLGKDPAVGIGEEDYQHRMALRLCQQGYVVLAPDWRGFGERKDRREWVRDGRDPCNVGYLAMGYFGYQLLGLSLHDAQVCLDVLQEHPQVDPDRLGMIGCSFGGTMTSYTAALDERVRAAVPICYLSTLFSALTEQNVNSCGIQYSPALLTDGDIPSVLGLIAPRPQMVQIAKGDRCFLHPDAALAAEHLSAIYEAAGARDALEKFAGQPPASAITSRVDMTRPAPLPRMPTSPSSFTYVTPFSRANVSSGSAAATSRISATSGWR
jgi:pimeloyl-ACP methyl ester carboxylesterase